MSGKFMKLKKITISLLTAMIITSTLTGCAAGSSNDLLKMLENNESIEIIVAEPSYTSTEQGTEQTQEWIELALRDNNLDFRLQVDELLNITQTNQGKTGVLYIDENNKTTNNSTLYNAFMNQAFIDNYWKSDNVKSVLLSFTNEIYGDLTAEDKEAAFINGYWNLFNDDTGADLYFNGSTTVTRAEFLSAVYKSYTPVQEDLLEVNADLAYYIPSDENIGFVSQMLDKSYLNTEEFSMNDKTYNASISKAEAVYTIVKTFYSEEFDKTTGYETLAGFENGGDIAKEQGFISDSKEYNCWKAAELSYAIENDTLPNDLYRAMVVADNHGLLDYMLTDGTDFEWSEGITKAESIRLIIDIFETLAKENGYNVNSETGITSEMGEMDEQVYDEVMQSLYDSLDCFKHVTYDKKTGTHSWSEEWEIAVTSFTYFDGAPEEVVQNYLTKLAKSGYQNYDGKYVYDMLMEYEESGEKLYTPPVQSKPEQNNNGGSEQESESEREQENQQPSQPTQPSELADEGGSGTVDLEAADAATGDMRSWVELDPSFELIQH